MQDFLFSFGAFSVVILVIVIIHELGHFIIGRLCNAGIEVFSVGFGPAIFSYKDKRGVVWRLSAIPLGGYVKFTGESNKSEDKASKVSSLKEGEISFDDLSPLKKSFIAIGGPFANIILAIFIFSCLTYYSGKQIVRPVIAVVEEGSAADKGGLQVGDNIIAINGDKVSSFTDIRKIIQSNPGKELDFEVARNGAVQEVAVIPDAVVSDGKVQSRIGISGVSNPEDIEYYSIVESVSLSVNKVWVFSKLHFNMLVELFSGSKKLSQQIAGPIKIAEISGQAAKAGFVNFLNFMALISISIAFLNLLPIPILDGGTILLSMVELIIRRPLDEAVKNILYKVSFVLFMMFVVFVFYNDIYSIFS